jgi:uncharacterized cupredoxin-like copper-binding protein
MRHRRLAIVLGLFATCALGSMAWLLGVATGSAAGQTAKHSAAKVTIVSVTAGKPSELAFQLSKFSLLPVGKITFKVKNGGAISHNFKVCTTPVATSAKNACTGTSTPLLKSGQSSSITVNFTKKGKYEFLCTVPGHAGSGMKGLLGVGVKVAAPAVTTTTPKTTPKPVTTPKTTTCASPTATTVTVKEFEWGFTLSQASVPCGAVTFSQTNTGSVQHNFDILGVSGGSGAFINTGQSTSMTVQLTPGTYPYLCDLPDHAGLGMSGQLTVTG